MTEFADGHGASPSAGQGAVESEELSSALVADALDALGMRRQCLGADLKPLVRGQRLTGRAFTVQALPSRKDEHQPAPYQGLLAALDAIRADEVFVFATARSDMAGVWGELVTTACIARNIRGAVTDGLIRDTAQVRESGFPVFSRGSVPYDSLGRLDVVAHAVPIEIDGVKVLPGDLLVGDEDGLAVIPARLVDEVLARARDKAGAEDAVRQAVARGTSVTTAFQQHGVL